MLKKLERITECHDPEVTKLEESIERVEKHIKGFIILLTLVGVLVALIVAIHYKSCSELAINAFGFIIYVGEESVIGSPFMIFLCVLLVFNMITFSICWVLTLISTNIKIKCKMLDNTYQTMLYSKETAKASFQTMMLTQEIVYPKEQDKDSVN